MRSFSGVAVVRLWTILIGVVLAAIYAVPANAAIAYVQGGASAGIAASRSVTYPSAQGAASLNVVVVSWAAGATVTGVTDSAGATYTLAGTTTSATGVQAVYYAKNVPAAASNVVTAAFSYSTYSSVVVLQYTGLDLTTPFDGFAGAQGSGTSATSASATATTTSSLVLGVISMAAGTGTPAAGYTTRINTATAGGVITEDRVVTATGTYAASATLTSGTEWVAQTILFRGAVAAGDTVAPTQPTGLTATTVSGSQIGLSWAASTDNVGVANYRLERCQGAGCSNFTQIATPTTNFYTDSGLAVSTTYGYRVRAADAALNLSSYSAAATGTTTSGAPVPGTTLYKYDLAGRLRVVSRSAGLATTYTLDAAGNRTQVTNGQLIQVSVAAAQATEGSSLDFVVTRTAGPAEAFSATCTPSTRAGDSATAGQDYTATPIQLSFSASDITKHCLVPATNDNVYDGGAETFTVELTNLSSNAVSVSGPVTGTILDAQSAPNPGILQFSEGSHSVSENAVSIPITVTRTGGSTGPASVAVLFGSGSATNFADFEGRDITLNWADGDSAPKTAYATIVHNAYYKGNNNFHVTLNYATGAALGGPNAVDITINEVDPPPSFTIESVSIAEQTGVATVTVRKSNALSVYTHDVTYETVAGSGTATSGVDYTPVTDTLSFAPGPYGNPANPGDTVKTFNVPITYDTTVEGEETFTVRLKNPTNGATIATATATVTIRDYQPGTLQFSEGNHSVSENAVSIPITVTRTGGSSGPASVAVLFGSGSATNYADFEGRDITLNWADGDSAPKTAYATIVHNAYYKGNNNFHVNLNYATGAALGSANAVDITINEVDPPPSFTIESVSIAEQTGVATVTVRKSNALSVYTHDVTYETVAGSGTATSGVDYTPVTSTLSFAPGPYGNPANPGETVKTFNVPITYDDTVEGDETFTVRLKNPTNGATIATATATVTIRDYQPGTLQFSEGNHSVSESAGSIPITVTRTGGSSGPASIAVLFGSGSAANYADFEGRDITLNWADGDSAPKSAYATIVHNGYYTGNKYFHVNLNYATGAALGSPNYVDITINESDPDITPPSGLNPGVSFTDVTDTSAVAHWGSATDNAGVTGYRYSLTGGAPWTVVANNVFQATLSGLTSAQTYTLYVQAGDAAGNWGPVASSNFTAGGWISDTRTITVGYYGDGLTGPAIAGYYAGTTGSLSPNTLTGGKTVTSYYDWGQYGYVPGVGYQLVASGFTVVITGFNGNPGADWLQNGSSATFTCTSSTSCSWFFPTTRGLVNGPVTIVHK